ncbi:uncharacterized protein LOC142588993 [Dermacentor variabilis]|uniref:uncharacterized protein LOC142588993 n=1 Tax=Dermacentor variabilis TaxID=34621 RepID=UPI003F5B8FD7
MKLWMKVIKPKEEQPYIYAAEERSEGSDAVPWMGVHNRCVHTESTDCLLENKTPEKPKRSPPTVPTTPLAPRSLDGDGTSLLESTYISYVLYSDGKCVLTGVYNQTGRCCGVAARAAGFLVTPLDDAHLLVSSFMISQREAHYFSKRDRDALEHAPIKQDIRRKKKHVLAAVKLGKLWSIIY